MGVGGGGFKVEGWFLVEVLFDCDCVFGVWVLFWRWV